MLAFILAASLALQPASEPGNPVGARWDQLLSALTEAQMAVDRIGHCTTELPARRDLEAEYQALFSRVAAASRAAQALYPNIDPGSEATVRLIAAGTPRCSADALRSYAVEASRSIALAEKALRVDRGPRARGLWFGSLQLCGGRVIAVEAGEPQFRGAPPGLILRFSGDFAARVRALTAQNVGRPLSVVLDGLVLMSPIVREPVGEAVSITSPDGLPVERIRAAAATPC